jgi:acyl-CoA reductase-like NAD-dependent aldehyde dehydrogenase
MVEAMIAQPMVRRVNATGSTHAGPKIALTVVCFQA